MTDILTIEFGKSNLSSYITHISKGNVVSAGFKDSVS